MANIYRMTKQEMQILSVIADSWERRLYPEISVSRQEMEAALESMVQKGFLKKREGKLEADRVMAGIMRIMTESECQRFGAKTELYRHEKMVILCTKDERSGKTCRLVLFPDMETFKETEYAEYIGGTDNG